MTDKNKTQASTEPKALVIHDVVKPKGTFCKCKEPKYNYPEMVWCDICGLEIPK